MIMKPYEIEVPRVSEEMIKTLLKLGIIYIGDDDQIHVNENISKSNQARKNGTKEKEK